MKKILFLNPNKWGRGITAIWIASHSSILKKNGFEVKLFDSTFYLNWTNNETEYNTANKQYKKSKYLEYVKFKKSNIYEDLQKTIDEFSPDIIFWSAISSHIHGEGEYVNIQYGNELLKKINTNAIKVAGGLQATAEPKLILKKFTMIDILIRGESELILNEIAKKIDNKNEIYKLNGIAYKRNDKIIINDNQKIISDLDIIPNYDYSIFSDEVFYRPYNGKVVRAVDYELSRGCIYACEYCVETVIQKYYGIKKTTPRGTIHNPNLYLRNKSAKRIFDEISDLSKNYKIELFRCQDTNFLTINRKVLNELSELIEKSKLNCYLYIETRPEGINSTSIELLKKLHVDGIGMGVELAEQKFREEKLKRFSDEAKIINAFKILKNAKIKRTAYNIIGLPDQTEESIIETINFNRIINPDNITIAFYSPYIGTTLEKRGKKISIFDDYEFDVDGQMRSLSKDLKLDVSLLKFYKNNFIRLVKNKNLKIEDEKDKWLEENPK